MLRGNILKKRNLSSLLVTGPFTINFANKETNTGIYAVNHNYDNNRINMYENSVI